MGVDLPNVIAFLRYGTENPHVRRWGFETLRLSAPSDEPLDEVILQYDDEDIVTLRSVQGRLFLYVNGAGEEPLEEWRTWYDRAVREIERGAESVRFGTSDFVVERDNVCLQRTLTMPRSDWETWLREAEDKFRVARENWRGFPDEESEGLSS